MFNLFNRKQEPEKKKPDFQGNQHDHGQHLIVFEGTNAFRKYNDFKDQYKKHFVVKNKMCERFKAIISFSASITHHLHNLQTSAISTLQATKNIEEMLAMKMGLIPASEPEGFIFCPACLQQAVVACEEVLQSLKDIEDATKEYT